MLDAARAATGDTGIREVAEFTPSEADHAFVFGDPGSHDGRPGVELPRHVALAVSDTHLHVLGVPHDFWSPRPSDAYRIASVERAHLEVRVTGRTTDRLLTLVHDTTGTVLELAAGRLSRCQPRVLCELLVGGPSGADDGEC